MDHFPLRPIVVFYDSCVPWKQLKAIVLRVAMFADHFFVVDIFSDRVFRKDALLFEEIVKRVKNKHSRAVCSLLVTIDGGFANEVKHVSGYGDVVKVVCLATGPVGTQDRNWEEAIKFASDLSLTYAKILRRVNCRRESEKSFQEACREILSECFGKDE